MSEDVERWDKLYSKFWKPLSEDAVSEWDKEFRHIQAKEAEVCEAIRELGTGSDFLQYSPRCGSVIAKIRHSRERESDKRMRNALQLPDSVLDTPRPLGFVCVFCRDKGWMNMPYVIRRGKDKRTHNVLPRKGEHPSYVNQLPCFCAKGKDVEYCWPRDIGQLRNMREKLKQWMISLPDGSEWKPEGLESMRTEMVQTTVAAAETQADMDGLGGGGDSW